MRDIKFRAWDKKNNLMNQDVQDIYDSGISNGNNFFESFGALLQEENMIVMQYTGLKDSAGNNIYEGDLLKVLIPGTWLKGEDVMEVRFNETEAKFGYFCFRINRYATNTNDKLMNIGNNLRGAWCEIIGNIYQNKELLTK